MKKYTVFIGAALAAVAALAACKPADKAPVEVAVAGPYSGDLAPYGIPVRRGVELAFADDPSISVNAQDDQCDASTAANVASSIIGTKAVAVVGHVCSGATAAGLEIYKQAGIAAISPAATAPDLTKRGINTGLFFRTIAPDDSQGQLQANFLISSLGVKTVAVLHDKGDYGKGLAEFAKAALEQGGVSVPVFEGVTVGAADYSAVVNKVAAANVDAVVFGGYHPEASKLISQLKRRGVNAAFIAGDGIKGDAFPQLAGADAEGAYATGPTDNSANPIYQAAKKQHQEAFGEDPGPFFYEGYAAALVIKQAITSLRDANQEVTPQSVREYIGNTANTFETPLGNISFNKLGDASGVGFAVYQVQNGIYVQVQ